jgi:hypothetical protein
LNVDDKVSSIDVCRLGAEVFLHELASLITSPRLRFSNLAIHSF